MNTHLQTFEKWLAEYPDQLGRRFHPIAPEISPAFEKQLRTFNRRKGDLQSMLLPGRSIEIYADFTDEPFCDAAAGIYDFLGLIAMTKGGIMLPLDMFFNMFSHPEVLPGIGDSRKERRGPQHNDGLLTNYDDVVSMRLKAGRRWWPTSPVDDHRNEVAQLCAEIVWSFIMLHELVHIVHGHVEYLKKKMTARKAIKALKANWKACHPPSDLDLQAIELWADHKAIAVNLGGFLTTRWNSALFEVFPNPEDKVFIWCFAMHTLFRIWGLKADPSNLSGDHPPQALRFQIAMMAASLVASSKFPSLEEKRFSSAMQMGIRESERAIVYCGGERLMPDDVVSLIDPRVAAHRAALIDHFDNVLRSELPAHSYVDLKSEVA